jgi:hypothetical protein
MSLQLYEKSRRVLLPVFDNVDRDMNVAAAYSQLAMFTAASGDETRANFFVENAQASLKELSYFIGDPSTQTNLLFLDFVVKSVQMLLDEENYLYFCVSMNLTLFNLVNRLLNSDEIFIQYDPGAVSSDLFTFTDNLMTDFIAKVDTCAGVLPESAIQSKKYTFIAVTYGCQLAYLKMKDQLDSQTLEIADKITRMTEQDFFHKCAPIVYKTVVEAALVHAQFVGQTKSPTTLADLVSDRKALTKLSERFPIVKKRCSTIMDALDQLIEQVKTEL